MCVHIVQKFYEKYVFFRFVFYFLMLLFMILVCVVPFLEIPLSNVFVNAGKTGQKQSLKKNKTSYFS